MKNKILIELFRIYFLPVNDLLNSCYFEMLFKPFFRLVNHLVELTTHGDEECGAHARVLNIINRIWLALLHIK